MKSMAGPTGFTLLEIILTLALSSLLTGGLISVYWVASQTLGQSTSIGEMQYTVREARRLILKDIYCSESIEVLGFDGRQTMLGEPGPRLKLVIPVENEDSFQYIVVRYYIENEKLYRERILLHDKLNSLDDQFLDKIPMADYMNALVFSTSRPGIIDYEMIACYGNNTFSLQGQARIKVDYSLDWI